MSRFGGITLLDDAVAFSAMIIEGLFYGLYSAIFSMYIQHHASKEGIYMTRNILLYPLFFLYILSTITFILDITKIIVPLEEVSNLRPLSLLSAQVLRLNYTSTTIIGLCDFISQAILIYRCWVTWGCNIRVIIIPSILALTCLATWLAINGPTDIEPDKLVPEAVHLGYTEAITSLAISLTVNAVVTGLILFRFLKMYWEVRPTFEDQTLGIGGTKAKLRSIIFIIIESGMAMFAIQLILVILTILQLDSLYLVVCIHQMFNGIIPTIILLRVSMGLSYHDEQSMVETAASWHFASYNQSPTPEIGCIEIVGQERRDQISVQHSDDIEIVDR